MDTVRALVAGWRELAEIVGVETTTLAIAVGAGVWLLIVGLAAIWGQWEEEAR